MIRKNRHKMSHSKFQDDIRKSFFTVWLFRYWNRDPEGAVASPFLEILKT